MSRKERQRIGIMASVKAKELNLLSRRPEVLPQRTTASASATVGRLSTHSRAAGKLAKE